MTNAIKNLMETMNIPQYGICRFDDVLPLIECRAMSRLPTKAKSIIVCLFPYLTNTVENSAATPPRNVSRYAVPPDYHTVAGNILEQAAICLKLAFPDDDFAPFIDNSPIREVCAAHCAGLGIIGENGLLINDKYGSYLFIGEIVTTLPLPFSSPQKNNCINCQRCVKNCPTHALLGDKTLNKDLCRSHITQKKGPLSEWETQQIKSGGLAWGCDICQEVCPLNKAAAVSNIKAFYQNNHPYINKEDVAALLPLMAWGYRGKKVIERNLEIINTV